MTERKLRVFLCHASQDKPVVRDLFQRLDSEDWIDPWLDEEKLLPGQDWDLEIEKAVEAADVVIVCLSNQSVSKEGYVQRELKFVLDIALEKPEGTIFVIPLRLDDCPLPRRLRAWHYVDYFPIEGRQRAYQRLLQSLNIRYGQSSPKEDISEKVPPHAAEYSDKIREDKEPAGKDIINRMVDSLQSKGSGDVDVGGSILLILYFVLAGLDAFLPSGDTVEFLLGVSAILAGIVLLIRRQVPATAVFKISLIIYLLIYGQGYRLADRISIAPYVAGAAAFVSGSVLAATVRVPKKPVLYSSISLASFLFLVGIYEIVTNIDYFPITVTIDTLILITSIITSILLWRDL